MDADPWCYFNGIDGASGAYLTPPLSTDQLAAMARGEQIDPQLQRDLATRCHEAAREVFGAAAGIDTSDLSETGWGVIFAHDVDPAIREAIGELLAFRRGQATLKKEGRYREFSGADGFRPNESARKFLGRHGVDASQPADPDRGVPYYLLLVGSPTQIPFRFQYQLDVQYAVGRIAFDTLEEYTSYARSLIAAEQRQVRLPRRAVLFGVQNPGDRATNLSSSQLVGPLARQLPEKLSEYSLPSWAIESVVAEQATKGRLAEVLGGDDTPSLLFTASHGMGFPLGDARQLPHQGALLCQDWPGPQAWRGPIPHDHYFAAEDVSSDASLAGLIAFHFACYGAGTPERDDFSKQAYSSPTPIAPHAFLSQLPCRMLGHPRGGALAVIGHVERAWGYSFSWSRLASQTQSFESALIQLMRGKRIGTALDFFNGRYAALATELSGYLEDLDFGAQLDAPYLASIWTAHNDARSYVVLGDPAARLPLLEDDETAARPALTTAARPLATLVSEPAVGVPAASQPTPAVTPAANSPANFDAAAQDPAAKDAPPATPVHSEPSEQTMNRPDDDIDWLQQISDTETRFSSRETEAPSFSTRGMPDNASPLVQKNDPDRIRLRLQQFGIPDLDLDELLSPVPSFRPLGDARPRGLSGAAPETEDWLERVLGSNDMVDAPHFLEAGARAARPIARIHIRAASGADRGFGTGFLISPRLLLTNNHVLKDIAASTASLAQFNYHRPLGGTVQPELNFALRPQEFFLTDARLDFTVVAIEPLAADGSPLSEFGWIPTFAGDEPILIEERVNIIQHPGGRTKQVALRDNVVTDILDDFIHYEADTEPGSSGAPVFNDQWQLVALHHSGVPRKNSAGQILTRDGGIWSREMGEQRIDWIANEGVRISRILAFVRAASLDSAVAQRLRDQLVQSIVPTGTALPSNPIGLYTPPAARPTPNPADKPANQASGEVGRQSTVTIGPAEAGATLSLQTATLASGESQTISIPLTITLSLGGVAAAAPPPASLVSESVSGTDLSYHLLAFDAAGKERSDQPGGLTSKQILSELQSQPITDVVLFSHGWRGDVPAAREQYQGWLKAMAGCEADLRAIRQQRPGFRPLLIGIHWPSEPWGDEQLGASPSFGIEAAATTARLVDDYAESLGDTPRVRAAIGNVLAAVERDSVASAYGPDHLPDDLLAAYRELDAAVALPKSGIAGAPGADWDAFDPDGIYQTFRDHPVETDAVAFGLGSRIRDSLLAPLRMMSFWKMKDRARLIGEQAIHPFLAAMQRAVGTRDVRFHLAGHSFGCIVTSAAIAGAPGSVPLPRPVDSLSLLQGALSLWGYCSNIPHADGKSGYFHRLISQGLVRGPIVTSQSEHDTAVGTLYPRAAQVAGQIEFAPETPPKYGAIGTFGIRGPGLRVVDLTMLPANQDYPLLAGQVHNVDGSAYINEGGGLSGAHSDIRKPEVAHLVWQAIRGN